MRNANQEIKDRSKIDEIIKNSITCRIGLVDGDKPYVVPMCFGYDGNSIYFHSATEGRKVNILKKNNNVCFEFEEVGEIEKAHAACSFGIKYKSVIGSGKAEILDNLEDKKKALNIIVSQYSNQKFELPDQAVKHTFVIKINIDEICGKRSS